MNLTPTWLKIANKGWAEIRTIGSNILKELILIIHCFLFRKVWAAV